jgi:uncharacterized RDD family membrane protein YckC
MAAPQRIVRNEKMTPFLLIGPSHTMPRPFSPADAPARHISKGKASLSKRTLAMLIDGVIAAVLTLLPYLGGLLAAAYLVSRDGLELDFMHRRSLGKHVMGLKPVQLDGHPMDLETSFRRNWMFGLGGITVFFEWIPLLGVFVAIVVGIVGLVIGLYEIFKVLSDSQGRRWGDTMAHTQVIEGDA